MENLRIATWNIGNSYFRLWENNRKVNYVIGLLEIYQPDILSLQELSPIVVKKINKRLVESGSQYKITAGYEKSINPIKNLMVTNNIVISNLLPVTKSIIPLSHKHNLVSQILDGNISINNTSLDNTNDMLNKVQMNKVIRNLRVKVDRNFDTILTATLNKKPIEFNMFDFNRKLNDIELKVVENRHSTYKGHSDIYPIDYVIIPDSWEIENVQTLNADFEFTSHYPVIVDVKRR